MNRSKAIFCISLKTDIVNGATYTKFETAFSNFKKLVLQHRDLDFQLCVNRPGTNEGWTCCLRARDL